MIKLIPKTHKAKQKLENHGEFAEIQTLRLDEATGQPVTLTMFRGKPAILVKHVDTGTFRWVLIDDADKSFGLDLDPDTED
jgi:hypothetical protein